MKTCICIDLVALCFVCVCVRQREREGGRDEVSFVKIALISPPILCDSQLEHL